MWQAGLQTAVWVVALVCVARACSADAPGERTWVDARSLTIEGQGWPDVKAPFDRLPSRAEQAVPGDVWGLSRHSAGIVVRFRTASPVVTARWTLTSSALDMPHMPATGVSGVDLYVRDANEPWRFASNGRPSGQTGSSADLTVGANGTRVRDCALYLPLYNGVTSLQLAARAGYTLQPAPTRQGAAARPVVVYGTSIVQGGCASRPGTAWTAVLGRLLEREVINLGFSGSAQMERAVIDLLAELDPAVFILDCLWNMGGLPAEEQRARIEYAARTLRRAHPGTPILFVGMWSNADGHRPPADAVQADAVRRLQRGGVPGLVLIPGERLMGDDGDGTVDGVHPTDLGMMRQATALEPRVRRALGTAR